MIAGEIHFGNDNNVAAVVAAAAAAQRRIKRFDDRWRNTFWERQQCWFCCTTKGLPRMEDVEEEEERCRHLFSSQRRKRW